MNAMSETIHLEVGADGIAVATMDLPGRPMNVVGEALMTALAAVVERKDGTLEYWALRHAAAQPDFHARDTFVLTLATATHKAD